MLRGQSARHRLKSQQGRGSARGRFDPSQGYFPLGFTKNFPGIENPLLAGGLHGKSWTAGGDGEISLRGKLKCGRGTTKKGSKTITKNGGWCIKRETPI